MTTGRALRVGTTTDMVRQFAAAQGTIRKKQVREALGLTVDQAKRAVETLCRQGFLRKLSHGVYAFASDRSGGPEAGGPDAPRPAEMEDRIRRAMQINEKWSVQDIAQQAGTSDSYIYKRMRTYKEKGWVRQAGIRRKPNGCVEKLWRLTLAGRDAIFEPASKEEFQPDPLVMKVVELNRLVCSGLAQHVEEHGRRAAELCREIGAAFA
jgi:hypothetical protein